MTRMQRLTHFLAYFWKDSRLFIGFSVVFIALPISLNAAGKLSWMAWSMWFWMILGANALKMAITILKYRTYIRFGR